MKEEALRPKKLITGVFFSGTARVTFNPHTSKIFIAFLSIYFEKSSVHHEL